MDTRIYMTQYIRGVNATLADFKWKSVTVFFRLLPSRKLFGVFVCLAADARFDRVLGADVNRRHPDGTGL